MGWLTPRGIFLLFSLITSGRSKWEISDDYNSSASLSHLLLHSAQLKRKFDFEGCVPFQLSNWPSKQFGMLLEMRLLEDSGQWHARTGPGLTNGRSQREMGSLMFRCNCFKALWNWICAGETAASLCKVCCLSCPIVKLFILTFWKLLRSLDSNVKFYLSAAYSLVLWATLRNG